VARQAREESVLVLDQRLLLAGRHLRSVPVPSSIADAAAPGSRVTTAASEPGRACDLGASWRSP
jgi:hypothetical protein